MTSLSQKERKDSLEMNDTAFPKVEAQKMIVPGVEANVANVKENSNINELIYSINDRPPWYLCIMLAFQHYILAFGGIIAIPLILAEPLCVKHNNHVKSQLVSTIFFVSGICTLLQTIFGTRLPILQGGTFSFITPTLAILSLPQWKCQDFETAILNGTGHNFTVDTELWQRRMREHYILAFGGIIAIPLILAEPLCVKHNNHVKSQLVSTIFFVSGICTLLQTIFGTRLPILQGGTFSFITPTLAILSLPQWKCQDFETAILNGTGHNFTVDTELWQRRMREIQGAIIVASTLQILLGFSGLIGFLLRFIGPLSIAPTITLIGLSLFNEAGKKCGAHWGIAAITIGLIVLFSQYLRNIALPFLTYTNGKWKIIKYPVFKLFPVLLGMCLSWLVCYILTYFNALPKSPMHYGYAARTDINSDAISSSPWFHVPYPGQWGLPTVSLSSVLGMMSGVLSSTVESVGDYYTCARLSGAPLPPTHALNRGIGMEGIGCILAGIWGTGNGTTSYSQNIAALGITKVGSRLVLQTAGVLLIILGLFGKFGAVFITIPEPVIGGMFMVMFGMIAAVGISNLQYVDLNSSRNLFVFGFSLFSGLVIPTWLAQNPGIISTGIKEVDQTLTVLLTTNMFVGGFFGCFLDNTIPGSDEERGTTAWYKQMHTGKNNGSVGQSCYDLPFVTKYLRRLSWSRYIPFLPTFQMERN